MTLRIWGTGKGKRNLLEVVSEEVGLERGREGRVVKYIYSALVVGSAFRPLDI